MKLHFKDNFDAEGKKNSQFKMLLKAFRVELLYLFIFVISLWFVFFNELYFESVEYDSVLFFKTLISRKIF